MTNESLKGLRILLVEDEAMIAMLVEDMLLDGGAEVVGPAGGVKAALAVIAETDAIDGALLDVNLGGEQSFEVADALAARNIPFVFVTGYGGGRARPLPERPHVAETLRHERPRTRHRGARRVRRADRRGDELTSRR
ncbi:response regulator [Chenggangzhangella methanolivorans]|uniref:response regulator n=1 Tax=Chenggangzhangella methanolivorans TaxID=1437009 RepID=UPI0021BDB3CA|nr:response regulator [Chenggangzhangella methanolivorans]